MAYVDPNTVHNPTTGNVIPASWGDTVRDCLEFLIDPPTCSVSNSAVQSLATNTLTDLTANTEQFDNDSMHSGSSARITIVTPGRYLFTACVRLDQAVTAGNLTVRFYLNGTTSYPLGIVQATTSGSYETIIAGSLPIGPLIAGDYVTCQSRHSDAGNQDHTLSNFSAMFLTR